ncbi:VOC family protein [Saccharopolyspora taberi]|uniref:Glyoxalase/bleomycin resistance/dioxygenase family protein n=1 Tax=Saccharopolyspora taberi TaxID=60895 RepID=A0ABN3VF75_9PSEU
MTDQLWRRSDDSSQLAEPRTFIRVFVGADELETTTAWYERLLGVERDMHMPYPEKDLALTAVGGFLIIAGTDESLAPFRATVGTQLVADIWPYVEFFRAQGAEFVQEPFRAPVGEGFTVRHPDGSVIEYVHHRPAAHELS